MTIQAPAPVKEIGYAANATGYSWWAYEGETTPELQWPQSVEVYDAMRRTDAQVISVLRAVTLPVRRTPWRIDPAGARAEVVEFIADDLGLPIVGQNPKVLPRTKDRFSWAEHLRLALLMLPFGFSFFEQTYAVDPDGNHAHLHKLGQRPARTIHSIDVARDGGLVSITQIGMVGDSGPQKPIPVDRLVAYVCEKEGGNWLGQSMLRSCYKNWLLKDRLLRVQAQTIERNGMGVPLYKAAETETDLTKGLGMATSWRSGEAAGSAIPFGADLVLRGVEGTLPDAMPVVEYHDSQIARAVLAHFLNLGTQTGSWALGTTFADFFTLSLQTLAQQIADTATQHIIEDLVDINFGEDEPAPRLTFDEIGSRQQATAQALKSLADAGYVHPDEVLEESTRQQFGLPPADPDTAFAPPPDVSGDGGPQVPDPTTDRPGSVAAAGDEGPKGTAASAADPFPGVRREPLRRRARRLGIALRRGATRDEIVAALAVPVAAKFDPALHPHDPHNGQWMDTPGGGAIRDVLKLLGKIDLNRDEHLVGSGKFDGDMGGFRIAAIDRNGSRVFRVGFGAEGFGESVPSDHIPAWDGNPSLQLSPEEHARLTAELDRLILDREDAAVAGNGALETQLEYQIAPIAERLMMHGEFNQTGEFDEYSMDRLATRINPAVAEAVAEDKQQNAAFDALDALGYNYDTRTAPAGTDPKRVAELVAQAHTDPSDPGYGGIVFDKGILPGSKWGDIHFEVYTDDPTLGPRIAIGVWPKGAPEEWGQTRDWQGTFDVSEWRKILKQIEAMRAARNS